MTSNSDIVSVSPASGRGYKVEVWTPDGHSILIRNGCTLTDAEIVQSALIEAIRGWAPALVEDAREAESRRWYGS